MISFFSVMIYVTSIIAIVVTLVFYAGILMSNKNISSGQVYTCSRFGCIWIVFAVVNIALSIVMTITNKDSEAMTTMGKLRSSCFLMGIIFLVFSVVLKVG